MALTIYGGLYFIVGELDKYESFLLFMTILIANVVFILNWLSAIFLLFKGIVRG